MVVELHLDVSLEVGSGALVFNHGVQLVSEHSTHEPDSKAPSLAQKCLLESPLGLEVQLPVIPSHHLQRYDQEEVDILVVGPQAVNQHFCEVDVEQYLHGLLLFDVE